MRRVNREIFYNINKDFGDLVYQILINQRYGAKEEKGFERKRLPIDYNLY